MSTRFTISQLEQLKAEGKIQGFTDVPKKIGKVGKKQEAQKGGKTKAWIKLHLQAWCGAHGYTLKEELQFSQERKFRFDFAIIEIRVGIEYEGLMSEKSRHTTITGYTRDSDKYNLAQSEGWRVLRYTAVNHKSILNDLNKLI